MVYANDKESILEAYCVKCREKREMQNPEAVFTDRGTPGTRGVCSVCGTNVFRMGYTSDHEGLVPPTPEERKNKKSQMRKGKLVIVESPAKARTVGRFLGKEYQVKASLGHVRDLLRSKLSVDVENGFKPQYRVPNEKREVVKEIKSAVETAEEVYLATDPDREGEAIAWHLKEVTDMEAEQARRVVFHEITKPAIAEAFNHPREINSDLVDAQQARRVLDRLVGYSLSPLLWRKIRGRLSAGRVQSVALRLIVERESEIEAFVPQEYWTIEAEFLPEGGNTTYRAKLAQVDGEKPELPNEAQVQPILEDMHKGEYILTKIKRGQRRRKPSAPFATSTLQQEASRRLGFTAGRTMAIAQQLYEGIDIGDSGSTGLITYMRTDSYSVSQQAQEEARTYILQAFGKDYLPEAAPIYRTRARSAQEAHEAIRPTSVLRLPEEIKPFLSRDQHRLYQLIWKRFVASQMNPAVYETISVDIVGKTEAHEYLLRVSGSRLQFPGFLSVYEDIKDEDQPEEEEQAEIPPDIREDQRQKLIDLFPEQHFTKPPPRYSEATLVRALEENGIGRPSTYAPILSTLRKRGYVIREGKQLCPTEIGVRVNNMLVEYFSDVMDVGFTAKMEEDLDRIASGDREWVTVVETFYAPFSKRVSRAEQLIPVEKAELEKIGRECPKCNHDLVIRWGRYGKFVSCSSFPDCRYTEAWLEKIGVQCPQDGGELVVRKTRKGRIFYGCAKYPECDFSTWNRPLPTSCPDCGGLLVVKNKRTSQCLVCETEYSLKEEVSEVSET
ncbi:MAG: type I DNA topoisomerase [Chloroflexota bacterium]